MATKPSITVTISNRIDIAAAHHLYPGSGVPHCERVHGHNWVIEAHARVIIASTGEGAPTKLFGEIKSDLNQLVAHLFDHQTMNDIEPFDEINPSTENFAVWILGQLYNKDRRYYKVDVWENYPNNHACAEIG